MKKLFLSYLIPSIIAAGICISCKKEISCEGCDENNKPPTAVAGPDQVITLPTDSISLDGTASDDPDGTISVWFWTKISGPSPFNITDSNAMQTQVTNLTEGVYQFELKVTDAGGLFSTDIIQVTVNPPITDPLNDVYVAGHENIGGRGVAKYWKNGQAISLSDGSIDTYANSIAVVGNDVYVAGYEKRGVIDVAKYWKNRQVVTLTNGSTSASATSIAVEGSDVYVAGYESNGSQNVAKYWKNGEGVSLTDGTIGSFATSIAVVGNDVYVAGSEYNNIQAAVYWKNGQKVVLSNEDAAALSITVVGADVYAAGFMWSGGYIGYWKNGDWVRLNGADWANSIMVKDNDVYVAGGISPRNAGYWKNGQIWSLTSGSYSGSANSIVVVQR